MLMGTLAYFAGVWMLALVGDLPRGLSQKLLVAGIAGWLVAAAIHAARVNRARFC